SSKSNINASSSSKDDYNNNGKSLLACSSSSSGSSLPLTSPRDVTGRTNNSDTSSTQSSSGDDDSFRRRRRRGRSSTTKSRREIMHLADQQQPHFQFMSHGKFWTLLGIVVSWTGFALAHQAWVSTEFVSLEKGMYVDPTFEEVTEIGMIHLRLCYNETFVVENIDASLPGCTIHDLTAGEIDDTMFQTARSMAFLAVLLGGFVSVFMTTSVVWHSINLRPIGFGYLIAYFLQSFTFLFFDADLCTEHKCSLAQGGIFSAVASLCWILACIAAARMDSHKFQKNLEWMHNTTTRGRRRRSRSRSTSPQKRSLRKKQLERRVTDGTEPLSDDSFDGDSPRQQQDGDEELGLDSPGNSALSSSSRSEGRRFASNGCEIIQGIQDLEAAHAWAAKSPKARSSVASSASASTKPRHNRTVSPRKRDRSKRPDLTIDTNDCNSTLVSSHMSSTTANSIGSPIQPSSRPHQFSIRPMPSPSKRLDHTGEVQRSGSPSKSGRSTKSACITSNIFPGSPTSLSTSDDIVSTPSGSSSEPSQSSATVRKKRIQRELDALDTLVEGATPSRRQQLWNHPSSTGSSPGISPASDAGVFLFEEAKISPRKSQRSSYHSSQVFTPGASARSSSKRSSKAAAHTTPSSRQSSHRSSRTTTEEHRARRSIVFDFLEEDNEVVDGFDLKVRQSARQSVRDRVWG
ncbi:MAG: hypothetical protein SGILL_007883, partial [Bacillariaceae sp.]